MEVCDERTMQAAVAAEKHRAETGSGSDFEEDIAIATGKLSTVYQTSKPKKGQKDSDDQSSDDQFDDFGPSDDEDFGSEGDDFDGEEEQSFEQEVVKNDEAKKANSKKAESLKAKNKVIGKKTLTKSKKGEDFNSEEEQSFDEEVLKKDKSKKTNLKKLESPKSKSKLNGNKGFSKSKDFTSNSEDESSLEEDEEMEKSSKVKKTSAKKYIDSPFPKSKNNVKGKKAAVNHDFHQDGWELSEEEPSFDEEEEISKLKSNLTKKQVDSPFPKSKVSINGKKSLAKPEKQKDIKKNKGVAKQLVISDDSEDSEHFEGMDTGKTHFIITYIVKSQEG